LRLPFLQHHLQTADPDGQKEDTPPVDRLSLCIFRRFLYKDRHEEGSNSPYRYIYIKDPGPAKVIGDITADRWTHRRTDDRTHPKKRRRHPDLLTRPGLH